MRDFDERLMKAETSDEVKKLKLWMFQEQVKIQAKKDELDELSHKLQEEKRTVERDRNALDIKIKTENKRFDQNEIFMSKKQQIIENAFRQLALDRKALECERLNLEKGKVYKVDDYENHNGNFWYHVEYEKGKFAKQKLHSRANSDSMGAGTFENNYCGSCVFFSGVDNELALRKRYKELLKIFHPDNRCGDTKTLLLIQKEYEKMKRQYYEV